MSQNQEDKDEIQEEYTRGENQNKKLDKYGYEPPLKKAHTFAKGESTPQFQKFKDTLKQINDLVQSTYENDYTDDLIKNTNQFNLLLSAISDLMSRLYVTEVEKHEAGQDPHYSRLVMLSGNIMRQMKELSILFSLQDAMLTDYLMEHPKLVKNDLEDIFKHIIQTKKQEPIKGTLNTGETFQDHDMTKLFEQMFLYEKNKRNNEKNDRV